MLDLPCHHVDSVYDLVDAIMLIQGLDFRMNALCMGIGLCVCEHARARVMCVVKMSPVSVCF